MLQKQKSFLCLLFSICLAASLTGCQSVAASFAAVEVNGKYYDLSSDFQTVITDMSQNEIIVNDMFTCRNYDKNGELLSQIDFESRPSIYTVSDKGKNVFVFQTNEYKTADNIQFKSSSSSVASLSNYAAITRPPEENAQAWVSLYVDGQQIDPTAYQDTLKELDETGMKSYAYYDYFPYVNGLHILTPDNALYNYPGTPEEKMLALAAAEALYKMDQGEVSSVATIYYQEGLNTFTDEKGILTHFTFFTPEHLKILKEDAK